MVFASSQAEIIWMNHQNSYFNGIIHNYFRVYSKYHLTVALDCLIVIFILFHTLILSEKKNFGNPFSGIRSSSLFTRLFFNGSINHRLASRKQENHQLKQNFWEFIGKRINPLAPENKSSALHKNIAYPSAKGGYTG